MIIEIEGVDGVGKTTVAKLLAEKIGATYLKFPDRTTPTGEVIDQMLRDKRTHDPVTFQALNVVNRQERSPDIVRCHRDPINHLVCDRYEQSAYVYGEQDGLDPMWLRLIMARQPSADLHVLLHADVDHINHERLAGRDREVYEARGVEGLRDQQKRFEKIWWGEHLSAPAWVVFDTAIHDAAFIVNALYGLFKVMVL